MYFQFLNGEKIFETPTIVEISSQSAQEGKIISLVDGKIELFIEDALNQPDLEDTGELINNNILFYNSLLGSEEAKTVLSIVLNNFENDSSIYLRKNVITFNILTHNSLWLLDDATFRVFKIMEELDATFNKVYNNNTIDMIGRLEFKNAHSWKENKEYSGYTLNYGMWNHS